MATPLIAASTILSAYHLESTAAYLRSTLIAKRTESFWKRYVHLRQRGIALLKGLSGTRNMLSNQSQSLGISGHHSEALVCTNASNATSSSSDLTSGMCSVPPIASSNTQQSREESEKNSTPMETANGVEQSLSAPGATRNFALAHAVEKRGITSSEMGSHTHTMQPVYNLTIEGAHCYYANGILVHNCDASTQAIWWMRQSGFLTRRADRTRAINAAATHKMEPSALYPV
jgi:hypothetical protein